MALTKLLTYFDPQPPRSQWSGRFASPFRHQRPPVLAVQAAEALQSELAGRALEEGKMFGVLVVEDSAGKVGYLKAFSGMLGGRWVVEGYAPPLFDQERRDAFWNEGQEELARLSKQVERLESELEQLRAEHGQLDARHQDARTALREKHASRREQRRSERTQEPGPKRLHVLAQESRADKAERKRLARAQETELSPGKKRLEALETERVALVRRRSQVSRALLPRMQETYEVRRPDGTVCSLAEVFSPNAPPGGSGDCAAPKLFGYANRSGLRPVALAEFWAGPPPKTGGRHEGVYYPACRGKCGPLLSFMLEGLDVEPEPVYGAGPIDPSEPATVFEDEWLVVVEKPPGLLSVPGRTEALQDSVLGRMQNRYPGASGPLLVHRLDLDVSGLLLVAKTAPVHKSLQELFRRRRVRKRYIAWLEGEVTGERGIIDLAIGPELEDRPRQIHDPVHGKSALTEWRVLERGRTRTKVALYPRTGRTHQLRVHAAHPQGLDAPIVGDRLYGWSGERLLLHAAGLFFEHPVTKNRVEVQRQPSF